MASWYGKKHAKGRSFLCILLSFCLFAAPLSFRGLAARAAETQIFDIGVNSDSVKAELSPDGTLTLSGVGETKDYTPETAPFAGLYVTSLEVGGGVSSLGAYLFYGCGFLSGELTLPGGLSALGDGVFSGGSAEDAAQFSMIRNEFEQCTVTKKAEDEAVAAPTPEPTAAATATSLPTAIETPAPVESSALQEEPASSSFSEESETASSGVVPETEGTVSDPAPQVGGDGVSPTPSAEPSPAASPEASPTPEAASGAESKNKYELTTITEQQVGTEIFFPGSGASGCFTCSADNESFRQAALQAGYREADRMIPVTLEDNVGGRTAALELPVSGGEVIVPSLPGAFSTPAGEGLYSYAFGGWIESLDEAGTVREPGSTFTVGDRESLYFYTIWDKEVLVKLLVERAEDTLTLTVPEIEGYDVLGVRWEICELPTEGELSEEELFWEEIEGETENVYARQIQPGDEARLFRCVLTLRKQSFFSFFSLGGTEEVALAGVYGARAAAAGQHQITFAAGTGTGSMEPVIVNEGDYGVIPACTFTAPSGANDATIVFDGWEDAGGKIYDPGQIVPLTADLALTARWGEATIRYVNGTLSGQNNDGQSADKACGAFIAGTGTGTGTGGTTSNAGAYTDLPDSGSKYTNIVVVCGNTTLGTGNYALGAKNATITSLDPVTGTKYDVTLTVSGRPYLGGDTCFRDIKLAGSSSPEQDTNPSIFAVGHQLYMGDGITMTTEYGITLYGATNGDALTADTYVLVTSGAYLAVYGSSFRGTLNGNTSVQMGGTAKAGALIGAGWYNGSVVSGNTEVLVSGDAQAMVIVGGNRASDGSDGVTGTSHVMVGGNARVMDMGTDIINNTFQFQSIGFVAGSGCDASASNQITGNVRSGTFVEIRENAYVAGNVFGGSGDGWAKDPNTLHADWMGTKGGTEVLITGSPTIDGGVYGGGNKRACEGDSTVTVEETPTIGGGVYGGGSKANIIGNSTITITGGTISGSVYGGGDQGDLSGGSTVAISGGTVSGSVYGGGNQGNISGDGSVTVSGGTVSGSVYGGGQNGAVDGSAGVTVSGGEVGVVTEAGAVAEGSGNVYGGGEEGAVGVNSSVTLSGGAVKNAVFGGSKGVSTSSDTGKVTGDSGVTITGGSLGAADSSGSSIAGTGNAFGGGEYAATGGAASVVVGQSSQTAPAFSVQGNIYGGGSLAPVGTSSVEIWEGEIKGSVFGAGLGAASSSGGASVSLHGGTVAVSLYGGGENGAVGSAGTPGSGTRVTVTGGVVSQSLFGAGKGDSAGSLTDGCVYGPSQVEISGGEIHGTVYGGGDNGTVGAGSLSGTGAGASMAVSTPSSTSVTMTGGSVLDSVFGGGSGSSSDTAFGAVFGSTAVTVNGGTVANGVYGGCNTAYISGDTSVTVKASQGDISIGGTVFGGGNLPVTGSSEGELPSFQEIYLVQGKASVEIDGSGTGALGIGGSVYGSGNLTLVKDHDNTAIVIKNFNGALESVQRAGRADMIASNLYLVGANDVTQAESHKYSVSQIDDLRLVDGTLLRVDREARSLGALGNYVSTETGMAVSSDSASRSTLQVYQGKKLQIKHSDGSYGPVNGVLWLDVVAEEGVESSAVGVSIQASADTNYGDGSTDTGAFVKADTDASRDLPLVSGLISGSHTYWQLGSKSYTVNETIQATHADNGGTGLAVKTFTLSVGDTSTVVLVSQRAQNGDFFLVKPTEKADGTMNALPAFGAGQTAGNTFALRIDATDSGSTGAWSDQGSGCYVLTADDSNNGGAAGIWKRDTAYLTSSGNGEEGEITLSLLYDPAYTSFTGGTVELTFKEYPAGVEQTEETLESTTVLTLTLEGDSAAGAVREAYGAAGRKFTGISGAEPVSIAPSGAVTGYFYTKYLPSSAGADPMKLTLYQSGGDGGTDTAREFPEGTKIVMAELSSAGEYHYYMFQPSAQSSVSLSQFSGMGTGSSFYPGPAGATAEIEEKLLFAVDFSGASSSLPAGEYKLRLSHTPTEAAMQAVTFTVSSGSSPTIQMSTDSPADQALALTLTPVVPAGDARFQDGALVKLVLTDMNGAVAYSFPTKAVFSGVEGIARNVGGTVTFPVEAQGNTVITMDYSQVPAGTFTEGIYSIRAELRPRTGLQVSSDKGKAVSTASAYFTPVSSGTEAHRSVSVTLTNGDRLMDTSEKDMTLQFTVSAQTTIGDTLKVKVFRKTGNTPTADSYEALDNNWCTIGSLKSGKAASTVTVPKGTASGTYRVMFQVTDSGGAVVAEEPYNFIVK